MKLLRIITIAAALFAGCIVHKKRAAYEFPAAMSEAVRLEYTKQCDKGKILYELNCGKCHNTIVRRKSVIPDFSVEKLIGYELRVSNPGHESTMPETRVNAEELSMIVAFLTYKAKTGVANQLGKD